MSQYIFFSNFVAFSENLNFKKFDLELKFIQLKFRAYLVTILKALVGTVSLLYTQQEIANKRLNEDFKRNLRTLLPATIHLMQYKISSLHNRYPKLNQIFPRCTSFSFNNTASSVARYAFCTKIFRLIFSDASNLRSCVLAKCFYFLL